MKVIIISVNIYLYFQSQTEMEKQISKLLGESGLKDAEKILSEIETQSLLKADLRQVKKISW